MADNETVHDRDVKRILAAELAPRFQSQGGGFQLMFKIEFKDGRSQVRPLSQCSCPLAIAEYERLYHRAKWDDEASSPGNTTLSAPVSSSGEDGDGTGSEYDDDSHLDDIPSDDSMWADMEDELGRPGTDPEARAAMRKAMAAPDETFQLPKDDDDGSTSDSDDVSEGTCNATVKSEAKSEDSLMQELATAAAKTPKGKCLGPGPRADAAGGVPRRRKAARFLTFDEWAFGMKKGPAQSPSSVAGGSKAAKTIGTLPALPAFVTPGKKAKKVQKAGVVLDVITLSPDKPSTSANGSGSAKKIKLDPDLFTTGSDDDSPAPKKAKKAPVALITLDD